MKYISYLLTLTEAEFMKRVFIPQAHGIRRNG